MALVTSPECGNDVSERAVPARPEQSRKTHPIRWLVVAAIVPLLVWDGWVSLRESKLHCVFRRSRATIPMQARPSFRCMPGRC
jgi:hypothetical protein